ncbi:glutamine synthetase family protein [Pseudonocardia hispaniensis]|uniref:Glutamine synthetase family protein n=1 Tax=Pseudonocardia hispaniensis TaxID=904933 RepID=A0ABW1J4N0_9PSEU
MSNGNGMLDPAAFEELVTDGTIDTVICAVPDPHGRLMGKRLTVNSFRSLGLSGEGIHASSYLFASDLEMTPLDLPISSGANGWADVRLVPDLGTLRRVPWEPYAALVICDAYASDSDDLIEVSPRTMLRRQVERAASAGLTLKFASELEFYLAAQDPATALEREYRDLPMTSGYRGDYQILQSSRDEWFIRQIRTLMPQFGIPVESSKTEWGLGQQEITLDYCATMEMADRHLLFKHGIKDLAQRNKLTASFMAKPSIDEVGSSCHLHVSLWSADDQPLGWADGGMSDIFGAFVAGQLDHAVGLGLMFAPTINSYKRFVPDQFAGTAICVGHDNRSCAFRLVGSEASYRLENRIPGADINPYYAYAATIAAGLDGIERNLPRPPIFSGNAWRDDSLELMPAALHGSIQHFADSKLARSAFGEETHEHLLAFYRAELGAFESGTVTDWERRRYFERI